MLEHSAYTADSSLDPELYADLMARITGERLDFGSFVVIVGTEQESGCPAALITSGNEAVAFIVDGGALGEFSAHDTNGRELEGADL